MLHTETVEPSTLDLIRQLQSKPYLDNFLLVGGTALALQMGHRSSTDIDLFFNQPFNTEILRAEIEIDFTCDVKSVYRFALFLYINNIKTDIVFQKSNLLNEPVIIEDIKMASLQDLCAMKLMAITNRGKLRDFVDIYFLQRQFTLTDMLLMWSKKYDNINYELVLRSLTYFEDAAMETELKWFFPFDWETVKKDIIQAVRNVNI